MNILFITADQWRGDCISAVGHPCVKTPNFDQLIHDGILFSNHYSVTAPCAPARASLLTGMYQQNHRVVCNGTPLDDRHTNLARKLRAAGYRPLLFGYTDTSPDPRHHSESEVIKHGYENMMPGFEEGLLLTDGTLFPGCSIYETTVILSIPHSKRISGLILIATKVLQHRVPHLAVLTH